MANRKLTNLNGSTVIAPEPRDGLISHSYRSHAQIGLSISPVFPSDWSKK